MNQVSRVDHPSSSMQAPTGSMREEIEEILGRAPRRLATARDLPRLARHVVVHSKGATLCEGGPVLPLLRVLHTAVTDAQKREEHHEKLLELLVSSSEDEGEQIRKYLDAAPLRARFVLQCLNQNIIAPAVLRLKYHLAHAGYQSKDGSVWNILVSLDSTDAVTHTRDELDIKGRFRVAWQLQITSQHNVHLSIVDVEVLDNSFDVAPLKELLQKVVEFASSGEIQLPDPAEYNAAYFNWK